MPPLARPRLRSALACLALGLALAGCGGKEKGGNSTGLAMKDLEMADGTVSDSMTDLDGVQSEGTAMAPVANAAPPAAAAPAETDNTASPTGDKPSSGSSDSDSEVVSDQ